MTVNTNPDTWRAWGIEGAEARRPFENVVADYMDAIAKLPAEDRAVASNALAEGWIDRAGEILSPSRSALESRWQTAGREMGELDGSKGQNDLLLLAQTRMACSDLATDLQAMTPVNRVVATGAMLEGYIRGYVADALARIGEVKG